jgi:hypothetical protein
MVIATAETVLHVRVRTAVDLPEGTTRLLRVESLVHCVHA